MAWRSQVQRTNNPLRANIATIAEELYDPVGLSFSMIIVQFENMFLKSLITHQVKTKEKVTVKMVWISDLTSMDFYDFIYSVYS